jgi:hypothetical protein
MENRSMSEKSAKDRFDEMFQRVDRLFSQLDKRLNDVSTPLDKDFPWSIDNEGFCHKTVTSEYKDFGPLNDRLEYKAVKTPSSFLGIGLTLSGADIEYWLNGYGVDGWDLNCFEFGYAIFSRFVEEDEDEAEEPEPADV